MFTIRGPLVCVLLLLTASSYNAQQPAPAARQAVSIKTSEVLLDVLVRDKKGRPVRDLKPEEIEVFEDGVKQPITTFTVVGSATNDNKKPPAAKSEKAQETGAAMSGSQQQLNLVTMVFDHLAAVRVQPVRDAAFAFIDNSVTSGMLVRVMVIGRKIYVIEQFTNDRDKLRKAVEKATGTVEKSFAETSDRIAGELKTIAEIGETPSSNDTADAMLARLTLETLAESEKASREVKSNLRVFSLLPFSRAHRRIPGRKMALYFSDGLYTPSGFSEALQAVISEANRANLSFYSVNIRGLLAGAGNQTSRLETGMVINATRNPATSGFSTDNANSFNVYRNSDRATTNFNTFEVLERNKELNKRGSLADLTEGTGGFLITNANDLNGALKRIGTELGNYYSISYLPTRQEHDGKFRSITVKILRAGLKAQTRSGYFALPSTSDTRPALAYETPLLTALHGAVVPHDFSYRSAALRFESRENEVHYSALVELPLSNFVHQEDKEKNVYPVGFSVMAMVKDEKGEIVQSFSEPHEMEIPAAMVEDARKSSFTLTRHFWLAPGRYTLETAVHDQKTGKISAERKVFNVAPQKSALQTGSLFLVKQVEQIDAQNNSDPENPLIIRDKRVIPDLADKISIAGRNDLSFHLAIFPDLKSPEKATLKLELLQDGKVIATTSPALPKPDEKGRVTFTAGVSASGFAPGDYTFRAVVKQSDATAEEKTSFTIAGERGKDSETTDDKVIASSLSASDKIGELTLTALKTVKPIELSPSGLLQEVEKSGARIYGRLGEYTYSLRKVRRVLNPNGKIRSEDYQDYEAYPIRGKHALIQLAENGARLDTIRIDLNRRHATDVLIRSDEEMQKLDSTEAANLNKKTGYWGASVEGVAQKRGQPRHNVFITIDPEAFFRACDFSSPRSVLLDGRETIVMDFKPRAGLQLSQDKDWVNKLSGLVWIDAADKALVRIEGQSAAQPGAQGAASESVSPNFVYQQQRLADGVWGPSLIRINAAGDETIFNGLNWDAWFQFGNYKRFDSSDADAKIVSPEGKGK
ncbi:MAG: VWA domain-containing protein [Blastocatellales bacterium]